MLGHVEHDFFALVLVSTAVEERELLFVFFFGDLVEGDLVEVLEKPRFAGTVALFGSEDVNAWYGHAGELVATGGFDVV